MVQFESVERGTVMSEPTIIAAIMLLCVFSLLGLTVAKHGVADAAKMWNLMGALTGVGFGAIVTYYFAGKSYEAQVDNLQSQVVATRSALDAAVDAGRQLRTLSVETANRSLTEADRRAFAASVSDLERVERTADMLPRIDAQLRDATRARLEREDQ